MREDLLDDAKKLSRGNYKSFLQAEASLTCQVRFLNSLVSICYAGQLEDYLLNQASHIFETGHSMLVATDSSQWADKLIPSMNLPLY